MKTKARDVFRDFSSVLSEVKADSEGARNGVKARDDNALRERFLIARANFIAFAKAQQNETTATTEQKEQIGGVSPSNVPPPVRVPSRGSSVSNPPKV